MPSPNLRTAWYLILHCRIGAGRPRWRSPDEVVPAFVVVDGSGGGGGGGGGGGMVVVAA